MSKGLARRFIAFGKISEQWHAVAENGAGGYILRALGARRRRIFTAAELATCARFATREIAQRVGRASGFTRTYATLEPDEDLPPATELAKRLILVRTEPQNAAEAAELATYIDSHPADHAAALNLTRDQLAQRVMLSQLRQQKGLRRVPGVHLASELPLKFEP